MASEFKQLFSPVKINKLEIKNRAVMPAMGTGFGARDGRITDRLIKYLEARARGGTGLIITEVCAVCPEGRGFQSEIGVWDDDFLPGLASLADAVHREGARIALQLHHAGRETFKEVTGHMPEAPSTIPSVILGQPCEEMSIKRIQQISAEFAQAALRAKKAGFDAVEIHGAHGYLLCQFLSPFSNHREDQYGGSDENRARFVIDILKAVRERVGPDFPVIIRVSADEMIRNGYDIEYMKWLAPGLVEAGADALHVSVGVYSTPGNLTIASMDTEAGFNLFRAREIKQVVSVPVIGVGRISDPELAESALARGDADLISFGRQHLADPDFIKKAEQGRLDDIRFCLACNACIERLSYEFKSVSCAVNPDCGRETELDNSKAGNPRKVWIIGAGPAGLSAAIAAGERGHQVEIFEREDEPGGQLRPASMPPNKKPFLKWVDWAVRRLGKQGIDIQNQAEITEDILKAERPDAVILAPGSVPAVPAIPGIEGDNVLDAREVLLERQRVKGPALVLGAGYVGMETADFLLSKGLEVVIMDMVSSPPVGKITAHGYWLHKRRKEAGGKMILGAVIKRIEEDSVTYEQEGKERIYRPVSTVITALGARSEKGLQEVLEKLGIPYITAGDAVSPRKLMDAVREGTRAGREI